MQGPSRLIGGIVLIVALTMILMAAPTFAQIQAGAGTCLPEVQANPDAQIKDCTAVIKGGQEGPDALSVALVIRGNAYAGKGDLDRAIKDLDESIKLNPRAAIAYTVRASIHSRRKEYDAAIADYSEAIKLAPLLANAYNDRGIAYATKGDFDRAIADYTQAIKLNPRAAASYNNRGIALSGKGDIDKAIADYSEAIKLFPAYVNALNNRGGAYVTKGDYARAITDYSEAIKFQPADTAALTGRCWARALTGQLAPALADCDELVRLRPDDGNGFALRGFTYLKLAKYDNAIDDYGMALWFSPKHVLALYGRGIARLKKGDKGGNDDIAAARALRGDVAEQFVKYGLR